MTRLRVTLLLLAVGIAWPTISIVQRAIGSLELESAVRHEAVAERVFDEMERGLSDWLAEAEARLPERVPTADGVGFELPPEPGEAEFVIARFVLDARGRSRLVRSAPAHRARVRAALRETWARAPGAERAAEAELDLSDDEGVGRLGTRFGAIGSEASKRRAAADPAPGRTRSIGKQRVDRRQLAALEEQEAESTQSAYDVLQSLNRAPQLRAERSAMKSEARGARASEAVAPSEDGPRQAGAPALDADRFDALERAREGAPSARRAAPEAPSVDPLLGRVSTDGDLVLARSVWRAGSVEREGVVIDRARLLGWLERRVLGETGLDARARLDFERGSRARGDDAAYRYLHRFAEPFDALLVELELDTLPGIGSARPIWALAALLAAATTLGLFAVHRMASVVVDYAERRSNFVAAVSHELKTPLTSIRMYAEMLRDGLVPGDAKRDEYHATIADESERLSRLIENVLEFSRLEKDGRELRCVVGDPSDAIREACDKLRAHVEREGFSLETSFAEELPPARFDRDAVTQLVFNLVDNAVKYARSAARPTIEVELARSGEGAVLRVRDFGPGVPEADLERVFEPFYRAGRELTRTRAGTGIGLALVEQLAGAMQARVRGRNAEGGGFEVAIAFAST